MALLRIPARPVWYWYEVQLHPALQWLRPEYDVYRVLLLMPVWGGWSMLNLGLFCRANQATEPAVRALGGGCGPVRVAVCMAVMLAATTFYFDFLFWPQLCVSGSAILAAIFGGRLICRFGGGLRRDSLLATNLLTQLAFLLAYLAVRGLGSR